ncbi:multi antimicrobial extrusion protein MatE [Paenibacillus albiflavus]|uniref:Multi antimicrobial extrusion protein MatE n=1 Tax=Paenibacillus albiflavus TaxID=2545760 RepID=A0A4V2WNL1_9BACL|nr:multi antimicrobial extrusion protein MatE [Paenibacillus albiflavus]TCZ75882.1 multi antimicrobial extrusion protein MatE [Paenibacillus albiflavus]
MNTLAQSRISIKQLLAFFIPLGLSSTLVTISHVIINSTLARSPNPEFIIATYAIPLSLLALTERPAVLLRQTCSALVRDQVSFKAMSAISNYVLLGIMILSLAISYTPLGHAVFLYIFGVEDSMLNPILEVYRILIYVNIFSGLRCLYHGLIIYNMRTKMLTIGMIIRLIAMYLLSVYFIQTNQVTSGKVGAIIFLMGMMIECSIAVWEGRSLLHKQIPKKLPDHPVSTKRHIFKFYRPLLYSTLLAAMIGPGINAMLGKTSNISLAIAAYALASSVNFLVLSFFSYMHQIVLNFYNKDRKAVLRFALIICFIPAILSGLLGHSPIGPWFLSHVMGVNNELMRACIETIQVFMIYNLFFPFLDFSNGLIMLKGRTKVMVWSQSVNVLFTFLTLVICILLTPGWNGMIGALAQSLGVLGELSVILFALKLTADRPV